MADPRFFCPVPIGSAQTFLLPPALAHHVKVLRLTAGDAVILFDGRGGEIPGTLVLEGKDIGVMLGEHQPRELELAGEICLYQGLPSGDKMDWVVEKSVELGVNRLIPITAQRSVLQLSGPRLTKRLEHWQRIAQAASEQCGRNRLMQIEAPCSLAQALCVANAQPSKPSLQAITRLFCDPQASEDLRLALSQIEATPDSQHRVELLIGPEGGWSEAEYRLALKSGAKAISFGQRVLRTETAGLALVSATTALLGW